MPEPNMSGGTEERQIQIAKIAGAAAAFGLLVMWMTPPTTPQPLAASPLDAFRKMHSDAPTLDPASQGSAPAYVPSAIMPPSMPWAVPQPAPTIEVRDAWSEPPAPAAADDPPPEDVQYVETDRPARDATPPPWLQPARPQPPRPETDRSQPDPIQSVRAPGNVRRPTGDLGYGYQQRRAAWVAAINQRPASQTADPADGQDDQP